MISSSLLSIKDYPGPAAAEALQAQAPRSVSDSWAYFKEHGCLPDHDQGETSSARGVVGGDGRGSPCPPSTCSRTGPYCKTTRYGHRSSSDAVRMRAEPLPFKIMGWEKEPYREDCGEVTGAAACKDRPGEKKHFKQLFRKKCMHLSCPACLTPVSRATGRKAATRTRNYLAACQGMEQLPLGLEALKPLWQYVKRTAGAVRHVIIYPDGTPRDDITFENIYSIGHRLFKALGPVPAYLFCFHPYRIMDGGKAALEPFLGTRGTDEEREARYWDLVHRDAAALGSWEEYVQWGPHYHGAVCGYLTRADFFHDDTGWNYKNVGARTLEITRDPHTGKKRDPLTGFLQYLASHALVQEGRQVFRAGNLMHSRFLKGKRFKGRPEAVLCGCGANVVRYVSNELGGLVRPELRDDGQLRFLQTRPERWEVSLKCFPDKPPAWLTLPGGDPHAD